MEDKQLQVIIPYNVLSELLDVPKRVSELEMELQHQKRVLGALRGQLFEVIEKIKE